MKIGSVRIGNQIEEILQSSWRSIFSKYPRKENKGIQYRDSFYSSVSPYSVTHFPPVTLDDMHYVTVLKKKLKRNTATGIDGWRAHELPCLTVCWLHLLDIFHLSEQRGYFPSSFYQSYTTLIPKGSSRYLLLFLPFPYHVYASLRCQTLLNWQSHWIHPSQYAFCKGRSTTMLNSHLSFDLLERYSSYSSFACIPFDFSKCFDSIPYTVIGILFCIMDVTLNSLSSLLIYMKGWRDVLGMLDV